MHVDKHYRANYQYSVIIKYQLNYENACYIAIWLQNMVLNVLYMAATHVQLPDTKICVLCGLLVIVQNFPLKIYNDFKNNNSNLDAS